MTAYDSLILDYDGVIVSIVDSDARIEACIRIALREFREREISLNRETISAIAHSVSPEEVETLSKQNGTTPERLWRFRDDVLAAVMKDAAAEGTKRPYPDVEVLPALDVPVGIASNNQRRIIEHILNANDLTDQFVTIHAREPELESLHLKKPSPTFLERAWDDIGGSNPLYVGDKQKDIIAARRAGMDVAFIRRDHNQEIALEYRPTHEVTSLEDVAELLV